MVAYLTKSLLTQYLLTMWKFVSQHPSGSEFYKSEKVRTFQNLWDVYNLLDCEVPQSSPLS